MRGVPPKTSLHPGGEATLDAAQHVSLPEQLPLFRLPPAATQPKMRHVLIGGRAVAYELLSGRQRLSMTIDERGLRVGAPRLVPVSAIEEFICGHGEWVLQKLDEYAARHERRYIAIRDGAVFPFLGGEARVRVTAGGNRALWDGNQLVLAARPDADLDALARRGLQRRAMEIFTERMEVAVAVAGYRASALGLSSARGRWGSCSSMTGIRLNWRLIHLPIALIDYVVAHELAHLVEMNHSSRFWVEVERLYPDWREARRELKTRAASIPII
jgi:predicted metal-dependent hydrolase